MTATHTRSGELGWALFTDWCDANQQPVDEVTRDTLAAFTATLGYATSTKRRWLKTILLHLSDQIEADPPAETPTVWREPDDQFDTLAGALSRVNPWLHWPHGVRERRDAALIVMAAYGLSRAEMCRLTPAGVFIPGHDPGTGIELTGHNITIRRDEGDPLSCAACALIRWVRILDAYEQSGRPGPQNMLTGPGGDEQHDCGRGFTGVAYRDATHVFCRVTMHGWLETHEGLATKTVSRIIGHRQTRATPKPANPPVPQKEPGRYAEWDWDDVDDELDRICEAADRINEQVEAAIRATHLPLQGVTQES